MCEALQQIREDGIRIGEKRGIALGEKQGIQKVAKELLKNNHPIPYVAEVTKLSVIEVEELKRTM